MFRQMALAFVLLINLIAPARAGDLPAIRAAVLQIGTVNWELQTMQRHGLDTAHGFALDIRGFANGSAARTAFIAGEEDVIVADWLWVARQRAAGKDFVFIPYSKSVGGLLVPGDSPAQSLADLAGGKIGIAGGPLDKSWLILRAYWLQETGTDLSETTEQVFAAPPLIFKTALQGQHDAALNFWHFAAKMEAAGMRRLIDIAEAAQALGLDPDLPLLGYIVRGDMLRTAPEVVHGFARASRATKMRLAENDEDWELLRPIMRVKSDAQFEALKAGFRAGIPAPGPVNPQAASRFLEIMRDMGGAALLGPVETLPDGVFLPHD